MSAPDAVIVGGALIAFAMLSRRLTGTPLTPAIVFLSFGLVAGTEGLDLLHIDIGSAQMRLLVEVTLALLLFADAAALDARRLVRETGFPVRLLTIALPLTILAGSLAAVAMFPDLVLFEAVALAVLLAPTDAALGQAVVSDTRLPSVVRQGLNVESGLNDGVCVPLLLSAVTFAQLEEAPAFEGEVVVDLVRELVIAGSVGLLVGVGVGAVRAVSGRHGWISRGWASTVPLVAAAVAYLLADELGGSGFIACFIGGLAFGRVGGPDAGPDTEVAEDLGQLLTAMTFVLFGAVMVGRGLSGLGPASLLYAVASLTVLRMIPVAIALLGTDARRPTVALAGWFGPRGLATIVFALTIVEDAGLEGTRTIVDVATITVLISVVAHGLSAPWLVGRYARWFTTNRSRLTFESVHETLPRPTREDVP